MAQIWNFTASDPLAEYRAGVERRRVNELKAAQEQAAQIAAMERAAIQNELAMAQDPYSANVMNRLTRMPGGLDVVEKLAKAQEARGKGMQAETQGIEGRLQYFKRLIPSDPSMAPAWVRSAYADPIVGAELSKLGTAEETIAAIPTDPDKYARWAEGSSMWADDVAKRRTLTAAQQSEAEARRASMAGEEANRRLRAQEIGISGRRAATEERRAALDELKASPEYQTVKLDAKEQSKREASFPKAKAAFNSATKEIDTLIGDLNTLKDHPGLPAITGGLEGRLPSVRKNSTAAQALLDKILAKGQFRSLQDLRASSVTGGALGNVSDAENKALRDSFGALSQTQGTADFQKQLDSVINDLQYSKRNIESAFDETYSYRKPAAEAPKSGERKTAGGTSYTVED